MDSKDALIVIGLEPSTAAAILQGLEEIASGQYDAVWCHSKAAQLIRLWEVDQPPEADHA